MTNILEKSIDQNTDNIELYNSKTRILEVMQTHLHYFQCMYLNHY
ncbi:hypothetical protein SDC9_90830 [bioreactor metagenome]|uniref:Uncharacterized protein n=1 Tax=bioreactor metagenome TaxID=1076179 RepID=A0A644ZTH1_9ZZZZ